MNWYLEALRKYATFEGRARRKEYWFFILFNVLAVVVLGIIDVVLGTSSKEAGLGLLSGIYLLAVLLPALAVTVRRLHDTDRSGWWILIEFIPLIGGLVLLVFTLLDSTPGSNRFGPSPKGEVAGGVG
ncbi:MAG: DUF805 domain-containing protein [Steroidobacteraceae bacterium]|nr:DUF805 domain-containing protein [Steroidobacteraceae bacterium]